MELVKVYEKLTSVVEELSKHLDKLDEEPIEDENEEKIDQYIELECCFYLAKTALEKLEEVIAE